MTRAKKWISAAAILIIVAALFVKYPNVFISLFSRRLMVRNTTAGGLSLPSRTTVWTNGSIVDETKRNGVWLLNDLHHALPDKLSSLQTKISFIDPTRYSDRPSTGGIFGCMSQYIDAGIPSYILYRGSEILMITGNQVVCNESDETIQFFRNFPDQSFD